MSTDLHDDLLTAEQCYRDAIRAQSDDAFEQACRCLSRGLQLIAFLQDDVAQGLRIAMNACMGSICVRLGRWHTADLHLHTSLSAARLTGDRPATIEAILGLGQSCFKQGKFDVAKSHLSEALALATESSDKTNSAFALMWLGAIPAMEGKFSQAERYLQDALTMARAADAPALAARTLNILGENSRLNARHDDAVGYYQRALSCYQSLGDSFGIELVTHNLGHVSVAKGDVEAAAEYYRDAVKLAVKIQAIPSAIEVLAAFAGLHHSRGESERALELLGLVLDHPACPEEARRLFAEPLLTQLRAELPSATVESGLGRGRSLAFDTVVYMLTN